MPLHCGRSDPSTHSELSINPHSHSDVLMSLCVFIFIFYQHSSCQMYLARANRLFPHQVKCNGNFRECTCKLNVCFDKDMPKLGDPSEKKAKVHLRFVFNSSIGCLRWYWSIFKLTHGEFCEAVFPVSTLETKDSLTSGTSWYSFLSRLEID